MSGTGKEMAIRKGLEHLWVFVYGNHGPKHSRDNHKYLQRLVEGRPDEAEFYHPDAECRAAAAKILAGDLSGLPEGVRRVCEAYGQIDSDRHFG